MRNSNLSTAVRKNFKMVFSTQLLVLVFGLITSLILPGIMSVEDFGYWQIYLLYSSYLGIFALGFNDGIYLRYGSYNYYDLPHKQIRTAIRIHIFVLCLFSIIILGGTFLVDDVKKQFIFRFIGLSILIFGINGVFIHILQITNQMKKYSFFSILSKIIMLVVILISFLTQKTNFEILVIGDFVSKVIVITGMIVYNKELWIGENSRILDALKEYTVNVSVGIKLMLAQLMGMLVIGLSRFFVEWLEDVNEYAYYSFGITVTNLVIIFITSISLLLYPSLSRIDANYYPKYYEKINELLRFFNILIPLIYYISILLIPFLFPDYNSVLMYLNILFCIIILQAKMLLLNNTFYKVLRKENSMLKENLNSVLLFLLLTPVLYTLVGGVSSIAMSTLLVMGWRTLASEIYLRKIMKIKNNKSVMADFSFIIFFMFITNNFKIYNSLIIYICFLILILYLKRKMIILLYKNLETKF
ncbi:lipopolysaccharide biosynthesis protein [Exiguobacterium aurantiacum]|uniref:Polysaccharide biosynthesis protein n=1 Tax=Exiguobacterium aurantiacum TaxID=33987 RepID=A0A377FSC0_9BACL|nr:oligosaccharide flippase family protein [Exiguobacterium aurantiacum]STO07253.1 Polysaccharide biosynthesis protein [Exiguobacterium aurantiacum]